jgi:hypothetical protein
MDTHKEDDLLLAVLIDAENISYSWVKPVMAEIARYGDQENLYGLDVLHRSGVEERAARIRNHAHTAVQVHGWQELV